MNFLIKNTEELGNQASHTNAGIIDLENVEMMDPTEPDSLGTLSETLSLIHMDDQLSALEFADMDMDFVFDSPSPHSTVATTDATPSYHCSTQLFHDSDSDSEEEAPIAVPSSTEVTHMIDQLKVYALNRQPSLSDSIHSLEQAFTNAAFSRINQRCQTDIRDFFLNH